jgi:RNA polymerase sigma-70 factor (ECF subfamily)
VSGPCDLATAPAVAEPPAEDEAALIAALRRGDEAVFMTLVERYHGALVRLALAYVQDRATAEEVAQDTWLGVLQGIGRFEGRSSLRTWIFRILVNRAKSRGVRERRSQPFSALAGERDEEDGPTVDPDRFFPEGHAEAGEWSAPPRPWEYRPDDRVLAGELRGVIAAALEDLPPRQRTVITLRDVQGWSADEVRAALDLSEGNQRVLLHRARAKVRRDVEQYFDAV